MTDSESNLDAALKRAATNPAERPGFYKILLNAFVVAWGEADPLTGHLRLKGITVEGQKRLPFFTSLEKLEAFAGAGAPYVQTPARALFEAIKTGDGWILNPGSPHGVSLPPEQIAALLADPDFK